MSQDEIIESNLRIIRNDIFANLQLIPPKRRYTMLTKTFSYCIYIKSKDAYNFIRQVIPLPCETILKETFGDQIEMIEKQLTDLKYTDQIIQEQSNYIDDDKIDVVLSVDAFSTTVLMSDKKDEDKSKKNIFIYLLIPLNSKYKPIILHLESAQSGAANTYVSECIDLLYSKLENSKFNVKYVSCDGDSYYTKFFTEQFDEIISIFKSENRNDLSKYFENKKYIWITDPLHIFKNGRTKIMNNKVVINPEVPGKYVNAEKINDVLKIGPILTDKSSVGKLRDCYPVSLFTFNNSIRVLVSEGVDSFIYLFIYALWNESLLNKHFTAQTRLELFRLVVEILIIIYEKYSQNKLPANVGFKKSSNSEYVTMFSLKKLHRIIPTLIMLILEIENNGDANFSLARYGSHVTEQQIGQIRCWCNYDHRENKIIHSTACHYFMRTNANYIFKLKNKRNRLNTGGCKLSDGDYEHTFIFQIEEMADLLIAILGYNEYEDEKLHLLIQNFSELIHNAPFDKSSMPALTSNMTIINRYYANPKILTYSPLNYLKKLWDTKEDSIINSLLLSKKEKLIYQIFKETRSSNSVRSRINLIKKKLEKRPWQDDELKTIDKLIQTKIQPKDCIKYFTCRKSQDIQSLYNFRSNFQQFNIILAKRNHFGHF